jgi:TonB family protein
VPAPEPVVVANAPSEMVTRLMRPLSPGLVAELGALTGCVPASGQVLAVEVAYKPTGQVREVSAPVGTGAVRCGMAARLLAAIDIATGIEPLPPTRTDLVMVGFRPEDATCGRIEVRGDPNRMRVGTGRVRVPRKVRNVLPAYPQEMQDGRVQGVVIVEAVIAATGCVTDATVLRGPHTTLNAAALAAVSAWQYEPTLLDGRPVQVIMTVTVNFTLQ